MTGTGTLRSSAASSVQRPSPESTTNGSMSSKPAPGRSASSVSSSSQDLHHRAVAPDRGDLVQVEVELGGIGHDLEAFGIGLHQPVLDAVVHHLHEVAGTDAPHVGVAALGCEGEEDRLRDRDRLRTAPDHDAVAVLQAPHAPRGTGVHEMDAPLGQPFGVGDGLFVVRVAPVDHEVALLPEAGRET